MLDVNYGLTLEVSQRKQDWVAREIRLHCRPKPQHAPVGVLESWWTFACWLPDLCLSISIIHGLWAIPWKEGVLEKRRLTVTLKWLTFEALCWHLGQSFSLKEKAAIYPEASLGKILFHIPRASQLQSKFHPRLGKILSRHTKYKELGRMCVLRM